MSNSNHLLNSFNSLCCTQLKALPVDNFPYTQHTRVQTLSHAGGRRF